MGRSCFNLVLPFKQTYNVLPQYFNGTLFSVFVCFFFFSRLGFLNRWTEKEIDEPRSTTFATYPFFVQQSLELGILKNFFFAFAYKEMRTRLGWTVSYKSLYFVHPSLDLVPLFTRMRERSIAAEFTLKQKYEAVTVLCNYRSEYSKKPTYIFPA